MTRRQTIRMIVAVLVVWSIVTSVSIALARRELMSVRQISGAPDAVSSVAHALALGD